MAVGLSSLLMVSISFMGLGAPLAQGDQQDQNTDEVAARQSDDVAAQLRAAVEGSAPSVNDEELEDAPAATPDEVPAASPEAAADTPAEPKKSAPTDQPIAEKPAPNAKPAVPAKDEQKVDPLAAEVEAADLDTMPMAVPPATGNNAVITVKVGGTRTAPSAVSGLAGVQLGLFANAGDANPVAGFGTCTSDAAGDCSFTVPETQPQGSGWRPPPAGVNYDKRFWVKQISAPGTHFTNASLGTTSGSDPYRFQTGTQLRSGQTYRSTTDFMSGTGNSNYQASNGTWQNSLKNPNFPQQCGIDVGMVLDLSNSVTATDLVQMKAAANGFVDALTGTPSSVGTFTFATNGPASSGHTLAPVSVSSAAGATTVKNKINGYSRPGGNAGGTNWDQGFYQVVQAASDFDVVVVITDGNPTFYANGSGPGNATRFTEVESGIFSANAIKAAGSRVIAFGVGSGVSSSASGLNLRSISGLTQGSDYYQTNDYAAAGAQLKELALGNCKGSVSVVKQVIPAGGTVNDATPAGDWTFTGQGSGGVTVNAPASKNTATDTGAANFPLTFAGGTTSGPVTLTETPRSGFTLEQLGGRNATCTRIDTGATVPSTNTPNGFTVAANVGYPISCTVYNRTLQPAKLTLKKVVANGTTGATHGPGDWTLSADGPTQITGAGNSPAVTKQTVGIGAYDLAESGGPAGYNQGAWTCDGGSLTGSTVTLGYGDDVTCTVTNTAQPSTLTLVKTVTNDNGGNAEPTAWTLTADGPTTGVSGATGDAAVTSATVAVGAYDLSESDGPGGYAAGDWTCEGGSLTDSTVAVGLGQNVTCTINNDDQPALLTLVKTVTNDNGGTAAPTSWTLTAEGPTAGISGPVGDAAVTAVPVAAGAYSLAEAGGPGGYTAGDWVCEGGTLTGDTVTVAVGQDVTCTINNDDQPGTLTLVKEVDNGTTGAPTTADAWTLSAQGSTPISGSTGSDAVTDATVNAGAYALSESGPAGYTASAWTCGDATVTDGEVVVPSGGDVTCTITNTVVQPTLTLIKVVDNGDAGSTAVPADWTLTATGPTTVSGAGASADVTAQPVQVGQYSLAESDGPNGYANGVWSCEGVDSFSDESVTIAAGNNAVCTVTNTAVASTLTLVKIVDNGYTGATAEADAWTLTAAGPTSGVTGAVGDPAVTNVPVSVGEYSLSEAGGPDGYTAGTWSCDAGSLTGSTLTVGLGEDVTCTITNTAQQPHLTLVKTVTNDNGGTALPTDWTLTADGPTTGVSGTTGSDGVSNAPVAIGAYALSEADGPGGYTAGDWVCEGGTLVDSTLTVGLGEDVTCTLNNDDQPASLSLVKEVDNGNSGATHAPADWTLTANGATTVSGPGSSAEVTDQSVNAGTYMLYESDGPSGYTAGDWTCDGATVTDGEVVVPNGGDVTCTITNTAVQPTLTLIKVVDNDGTGGTSVPSDWTLTATGPMTISGAGESAEVTDQPVQVGQYSLTESGGPAGYANGVWSCEGADTFSDDSVTIAPGNDAVCTVINTSVSAALTLVKVVDNADTGATTEADAWTLTATGPTSISGTTGTSGNVQVGTYELSEDGPAGYDASEWVCTGATSSTATTVTVGLADDATCTITNTAKAPALTLVKVVDNGYTGATTEADAWTLTAAGPTSISGTTGTTGAAQVGTYELSESGPAGYDASEWVCTGATSSTATTVTVGLADDATCTITNTAQQPHLTLVKTVTNDDGGTALPTDWTLTADGPSTGVSGAVGADPVTNAPVAIGGYELSEADGPGGYTAGDWVCEGGSLTDGTVTVGLGADVTCTINNDDQPAFLTLVKAVTNDDGGTANAADWQLSAIQADGATNLTDVVSGTDAATAVQVEPGSYALGEGAGPANYDWTDLSCTNNGTAMTGVDLENPAVDMTVGDNVTCTFTNDDTLPELKLVKTISGAAQSYATNWTLSATAGDDTLVSGEGGTDFSEVPASTDIVLSEVRNDDFEDAGEFTDGDTWVCVDAAANNSGVDTSAENGVSLVSGNRVVCTITNTFNGVEPTITKTAADPVNNADGSWATTYTVTVTNPSSVAEVTYDVQDQLLFGGGATITSATVSGPGANADWNGSTDQAVATGQTLAAGADPAVYTVIVDATITDGAFSGAEGNLVCLDNPADRQAGGFLNAADLLVDGTVVGEAEDCVAPALPEFVKTVGTPAQQADGSWNVVYTLTATNASALPLYYDLSDTLGFDSDLVINTATASGPDGEIDAWNGDSDTTLATGAQLPAASGGTNGEHVYTVSVNVTVPATASAEDFTCGVEGSQSGTGTYNAATLSSSGQGIDSDACTTLPLPQLSLGKEVRAISQNPDGRWSVHYVVTITNGGEVATRYNLGDTLEFGDGLTPVEALWERTTPADPALEGQWVDPAGNPSTTFSTDELIRAGESHVYSVDVVATVAAGDSFPDGAICTGEDGTGGGGFLNSANVTFPGGTDDAAACTEPSIPEMDKTFVSAIQNDDSTWTVVYDLTVDNSDGQASHYTLQDEPGFPAEIDVLSWSVTPGADTPDPGIDSEEWAAPGTIADNTEIFAGATHTYRVAFTVEIPANLPAGADQCTDGAGSGFFNEATLTSGEQVRDDDACHPIEEVGVPSLTKTATGASQNADGTWTITYDVTVGSNADFVTKYTLTDTLRFGAGVTVASASWAGGGESGSWSDPGTDPTTTIATDRVLAKAAADEVYSVTVVAAVSQSAIGTTDLDCTVAEGEDGTGFLNEATMTSGKAETTRQDCESPTEPGIDKDGASVVQLGDGTWNVSYDLTVDNTDGHATFYDLTDTPAFPDGIDVNTWSVTAAEGTPAVDITGAAFTDGTIVAGQAIEADTVHAYTVVFSVDIAITIDSELLECAGDGGSAGHGFFNTAVLGVGDGDQSDTDCIDIPTPGTPTVEKTLGTVVQNDTGMWTVTYNLAVTGHETQATRYTLVDTLEFGDGASIESATWTWDDADDDDAAQGSWTAPVDDNPATVLATDRLLPGKVMDLYTVTVVVDVAEGATGTSAMSCDADIYGNQNGGFLNRATLMVGETPVDEAQACGEPASVDFSKTADSFTANEDGTFDAVYTLTVTSDAEAGQTVVYSVSDTPVIPAGVELVSRTATSDDGAVDEAWNSSGTNVIAANQSIGEGEDHVYTVTLTIRVTEPLTPEQRECESGEGQESGGLVNTGSASTGNDDLPAEACVDLPDPSFTVEKVADEAVETEVGTWEVTYTVTVANTSEAPGTYSLADTLRYGTGITPTAAAWELLGSDPAVQGTWDLAAGRDAVLATDAVLAAGGVHTYAVTVTADVEPTVVGTDAGICESESGTGDRAFFNEATLTWDDESREATDCAEPFVSYGSLNVTKQVVGETAGFAAGDDAVFEFAWVCTTPADETLQGTAMVADGETALLTDEVPVGSTCSVTETAPVGNLDNDSYRWGTPALSAESVTLTIAQPDATVAVENPIERAFGALTITKVVDGLGASGLDEDVVFSGTWGCVVEGGRETGEWSITGPGSVVVAEDLLVGSRCDVVENAPAVDPVEGDSRYTWDGTVIDDAVTIVVEGSELSVTNTVAFGEALPDPKPTPEPTPQPTPEPTPQPTHVPTVTPDPKPDNGGALPNTGAGNWGGIAAAGALLVALGSLLLARNGRRRRQMV